MAVAEKQPINALSDEEWGQRLKMGRGFMRKFRSIDRGACQRFRDPSITATNPLYDDDGETPNDEDGGDLLQDIVVGQPNLLTNMLLVGVAAVTIRRPDFLVTMKEGVDPKAKTEVRDKYRNLWKKKDWNRRAQMAYLKRKMVGHGFIGYRWDTEIAEPDYQHVQSWNIAVDPCINDWQNIRWGGYRITMPLRVAQKRYPGKFDTDQEAIDAGNLDKKKIKVWLMYDKDTEVHILDQSKDGGGQSPGGKVLKRAKNRYGKVPILCVEGDPDPGPSEFCMGDSQLAAGLQQEYNDCNQIVSDMAKHGGPINLYQSSGLDKGAEAAITNGKPQQWVPVKDLSDAGIPMKRIPAEELGSATLDAKAEARRSLQEWVGVSASMLGSPEVGARFATDIASINAQSGVRVIQNRSEYEAFLDKWAETTLALWIEFGGPRMVDGAMTSKPEQVADWELLQAVESVCVVESSTMYKDPSADQTSSMQLYQMMSNAYELYLTRAQMGLSQKLPNLEMYANDVLRAFGKQNVDEYWQDYQAPQQQQQGKPPSISINYKDLDPQDQMAAAQLAGLPGQQPGPPQEAGGTTEAPEDPNLVAAQQEDQQHHDAAMQAMKFAHDTRMQQMKHAQAVEIENLKQQHAGQMKLAEIGHNERMAAHQAATQTQLAETNNQAKVEQIKAKPAPTGGKGGTTNGGTTKKPAR